MKNILFVNSIEKQCGVHSYGLRTMFILAHSEKYNFIHCQISSENDYIFLINKTNPSAIIINYHPLTTIWANPTNVYHNGIPVLIINHEGTEPNFGNYYLTPDSIFIDNGKWFSLPRPLIESIIFKKRENPVPIISSFGMAFGNKGFGRIVQIVNQQFDEAIIRLHLPRAYYGDKDGEATAGVLPGCQAEMKKEGIKLEFSHDFLADNELLQFISESDLNIFLYDEMKGRGLSSVIDYALSVDVPIAINNSDMFRHIQKPEINVANKTLKEIIEQGTEPLKEFNELWSNKNLIEKYEHILDTTL